MKLTLSRHPVRLAPPGLVLGLLTATATADVVILHNGDRLTGTVLRQEDGQLQLETHYAGTLSIDWEEVRECRLDEPATVLLEDNKVVEVAAIRRDQGRLRLQAPDADAPMTVAAERVEVVNPEPWELGRGHRLSGAVNAGLQDSRGNSTSTELDLDFNLSYRRRWDEFESFGQLDYDTTRGTKTTEQWSLRNKYIRRFPHTAWYGAVWLRFRHDRFADLRLRTIIGPGLGYQLQESEDTRLSVELGPVHIREDYYDQNDLDHWGPGLFMDYEQDLLGDRVQLYLNGMGFTTISGDSLDISNSWAGLRIPLVGGFVSSIEYEVDYDSSPAEGAKTTDETLRLKMGYQW
ncbi:MAG: DUF481 domain-containing protein [Thiohalocapsa sp.]|nr:DUF481 domain-containing protein [Thiohalocapsa sp.]